MKKNLSCFYSHPVSNNLEPYDLTQGVATLSPPSFHFFFFFPYQKKKKKRDGFMFGFLFSIGQVGMDLGPTPPSQSKSQLRFAW